MNETLPRMVFAQSERLGEKTALRRKESGAYRDISWKALGETLRLFGRALLALGLQRGERVAIMAPNSPEWAFADLAAMACGALSVPVYHTEGMETALHIVNDSGSRILFTHSPLVAEEFSRKLKKAPTLEYIVLLTGVVEHPRVLTQEAFLALAEQTSAERFAQELAGGDEEDVATLVYTSGTTGRPKGAMLTHRNFLSNIEACLHLFDIGATDQCLSFLPLSHVFERMAGYYLMLRQGATIAYAEGVDSVPANLLETHPTVVMSVPRLYEKLYSRVMERVLSGSWVKKQLFFGALRAAKAQVGRELAGETPGSALRAVVALSRRLVFSKLRTPLGGQLRFFVSGGAPLAPHIAEFFLAVGIPIYEGYGLTETSPVIAANAEGAMKLGSVGRPIPGTEVRLAEDGEILVKGPGVFQGYWNAPEKTEAAFAAGWFKTGDIGERDERGFLTITDRKKDLIVTAGGENIAPQNLENLFKADKFLANAMVYGDRKPYLTALLVPNFDTLEKYARIKEIIFLNHCDLVNHPRILDLIRRRLDRLQSGLPSIQHVKRFTLLSQDFAREEVTPTLKIRRHVIRKHFHNVLEGMYLAAGKDIHDSGFCMVENGGELAQTAAAPAPGQTPPVPDSAEKS